MKHNNIWIIIQREFNERVRKKSFIFATLLMPFAMLLLMTLPALIMIFNEGDDKQIAVVDQSGVIASQLQNRGELIFNPTDLSTEEARQQLTENFGVLYIGSDIMTNPSNVRLYVNSSSSMMIEENITGQIEDIIKADKLKKYNIDNLDQILQEVETTVSMKVFRNDESQETDSVAQSSAVAAAIGYILGFLLYMFLLIYGAMVMQAVIEEKNSRVLELLVSSVRPFDLMMGKILGVAAVAVTQILIWAVLIIGIGTLGVPHLLPENMAQSVEAVQQGADASSMVALEGMDIEMVQAVATATDFGYMSMIFISLILFMLGGYLLYSAMFAAVGSAVDNVQDAGQLQMPIMLPIILALMVMLVVINDPNSQVAFWFSMIPFTSPIVMIARIPCGIPMWEIILSLVLLYTTFIGMVWMAGKIYRVGIFMYGKKPSFKEIYKWMKYKY